MENDECWNTFLTSGKVTDYLNYKNQSRGRSEDGIKGQDNGNAEYNAYGGLQGNRKETDDTNAGFY